MKYDKWLAKLIRDFSKREYQVSIQVLALVVGAVLIIFASVLFQQSWLHRKAFGPLFRWYRDSFLFSPPPSLHDDGVSVARDDKTMEDKDLRSSIEEPKVAEKKKAPRKAKKRQKKSRVVEQSSGDGLKSDTSQIVPTEKDSSGSQSDTCAWDSAHMEDVHDLSQGENDWQQVSSANGRRKIISLGKGRQSTDSPPPLLGVDEEVVKNVPIRCPCCDSDMLSPPKISLRVPPRRLIFHHVLGVTSAREVEEWQLMKGVCSD